MFTSVFQHKHEALNMEVNLTKNDAILAYNELNEWMKPEKVRSCVFNVVISLNSLGTNGFVLISIGNKFQF